MNDTAKHAAPDAALVWWPNQRVYRSALQSFLGFLPVAVIVLGVLAAAWPTPWLIAAAGSSVTVQVVASKIMTNPTVNAWLIEWTPFGTAPQGTRTDASVK